MIGGLYRFRDQPTTTMLVGYILLLRNQFSVGFSYFFRVDRPKWDDNPSKIPSDWAILGLVGFT